MPAASVAVEQENAQLFFQGGVLLNRAMVLGLGIADDVINALLNLQKIPRRVVGAVPPAPALTFRRKRAGLKEPLINGVGWGERTREPRFSAPRRFASTLAPPVPGFMR